MIIIFYVVFLFFLFFKIDFFVNIFFSGIYCFLIFFDLVNLDILLLVEGFFFGRGEVMFVEVLRWLVKDCLK